MWPRADEEKSRGRARGGAARQPSRLRVSLLREVVQE